MSARTPARRVDAPTAGVPTGRRPNRWTSDVCAGVIEATAALRSVDQAITYALMFDEARWQPENATAPIWRMTAGVVDRVARRTGLCRLTVRRHLRDLTDAGTRWSYNAAGELTYGAELLAAVLEHGTKIEGEPTNWLHTHTRDDVPAILDAAAERVNRHGGPRWSPVDAVVMITARVLTGGRAHYDGTHRRIADLAGVDRAEVTRSLTAQERAQVITQGRRHYTTEPGDPEPQAERLGHSLHVDLLRHRQYSDQDSAARRWIAAHGRTLPAERPGPAQGTLAGTGRRCRRMSAVEHAAAMDDRAAKIARARAPSARREAAEARTRLRRQLERRIAAILATTAPSGHDRPPEPPLRT